MDEELNNVLNKLAIRLDDLGGNVTEEQLLLLDELCIENAIRILKLKLSVKEIKYLINIDHSKVSNDYFEIIINNLKNYLPIIRNML